MENEYGILEIETDENGEFDKQTSEFILEKIQEAVDENIWYTQEEANDLLNKMVEENERYFKNTLLQEQNSQTQIYIEFMSIYYIIQQIRLLRTIL